MSTEYVFNYQLGQIQVPLIRPKMWSESSIQMFITEPYWAWNRGARRIPTEQGVFCLKVRHWMDKSEYVLLITQMSIANHNNP